MYYNIIITRIIYFLHTLLIAYGISIFYTRVLTPRKFLRHPLRDCFIVTQLFSTVMTFSLGYAVFTSVWFFLSHLIVALILFKDRKLLRFAAYIFAVVSYSFTELIPAGVLLLANIFFPSLDLTPKYLLVSGNVFLSAFNCFSLAIIYFIFLKKVSAIFSGHFSTLKPKSLLLISLPFMIVVFNTYLGELASSLPMLFLVTPLMIAGILLCIFLLQKGFLSLKHEEILLSEKKKRQQYLEQQIEYYKIMDTEYLALRKWRHDAVNHLSAIAYLLETRQYTETGHYLKTFLDKNHMEDINNEI